MIYGVVWFVYVKAVYNKALISIDIFVRGEIGSFNKLSMLRVGG